MLKVLLSVFLALIFLFPLHSDNMQKLYTVRDSVYRRTDALCRRNGAVGPSSFSPMSARALEIALERLDPAELNESDRAEWLELMSQVSERDVIFSYREMSLDVSLDFNIQANAADYALFDYSNRKEEGYGRDMRNEALVSYRYEKPFGTIRLDLFFGPYVALEGELFLGNNNHHMYETSLGWLLTRYDGKIYTAASPSEEGSDLSFTTMSMDLPHRAGISAGNDYISFAAGRFPHSAGSGVTGNLVAGDNFSYQEIAALSFMNRYFTYNISVTRFDREENTGPYSFAFSRVSGDCAIFLRGYIPCERYYDSYARVFRHMAVR